MGYSASAPFPTTAFVEVLRFELMLECGPCEAATSIREEAQLEALCRIGCFGDGDRLLHRRRERTNLPRSKGRRPSRGSVEGHDGDRVPYRTDRARSWPNVAVTGRGYGARRIAGYLRRDAPH